MRAYVINLPRSQDRRIAMERQLDGSGLDYEFIEAVDGRALTPEDRAGLVDESAVQQYPRWLTPKSIGCSLSHQRVCERIIADGSAATLVLEDDALIPPGLGDLAEAVSKHLASDEAILLHFRSFKPCLLERNAGVTIGNHRVLRPRHPRQALSALAYIIGPDAAASLAATITPIRLGADSWGARVEAGIIGSLRIVVPSPVRPNLAVESTANYSAHLPLRSAIKQKTMWPIPQLRLANRRRVDYLMSRFKVVDAPEHVIVERASQ